MRALALFALLLAGCDEMLKSSSREERISKLEGRVTALEAEIKQKDDLKADQTQEMDLCLARAEERYWTYVKLNGHQHGKPDENGDVVYRAPTSVWDQAAKLKQNAIEECRIRFGR